MISAPRIVVVSVVFFLTGLFYYSPANGADYTISERNSTAASAMKGSLHKTENPHAKEILRPQEGVGLEYASTGQLQHNPLFRISTKDRQLKLKSVWWGGLWSVGGKSGAE